MPFISTSTHIFLFPVLATPLVLSSFLPLHIDVQFLFHSLQLSTGEFLSLAAMDIFLRSVQPEVNDFFVLSLVLINLLAWMDLFITQVTFCFANTLVTYIYFCAYV